jgi:hypothetical protein
LYVIPLTLEYRRFLDVGPIGRVAGGESSKLQQHGIMIRLSNVFPFVVALSKKNRLAGDSDVDTNDG